MKKLSIVVTVGITLLCIGMKFNSVAMNNDPGLINQLRKINTAIEKKEQELEKAGRLEEVVLSKELNALRAKQAELHASLFKGEAKARIRESIPAKECSLSKKFIDFLYYEVVKKTKKTLQHNNSLIIKTIWSPDRSKLATVGNDGTVKIWNIASGEQIGPNLTHGNARIDSITWSHDSSIVVVASDRYTSLRSIPDLNNPDVIDLVPGVSFSASATVWDANTGVQLKVLQNVKSAAWSPEGNNLATVPSDYNIIRILDTTTWTQTIPDFWNIDPIDKVIWSPNGRKFAVVSNYGKVKIWDTLSATQIGPDLIPKGYIKSVEWSPDGSKILTASGRYARIWDATTGAQIHNLYHRSNDAISLIDPYDNSSPYVSSAAYSPDGNKIATVFKTFIKIWDAKTGINIGPNIPPTDRYSPLVAWSPDGTKLAVGRVHTVEIFNTSTGAQLGPKLEPSDVISIPWSINSIIWSPHGKKLLAAVLNTVVIWEFPVSFLDKLSINQCELLQAFDMAIKEKGRIQATPSQWHTFITFPTAIVDVLNLYIRRPTQPAQHVSNQVLFIKLPGQFDPDGIFSNGNITSDFIEVLQENSEPITYQTYAEITSNPNGAILAVVETQAGNRTAYNVYDGLTLKNWLASHPDKDPINQQPINEITYYITPSASEPFEIIPIRPAKAPATEQYPSNEIVSAFFKAVEGNPVAQITVGNYYRDKGATRIANQWFRKAGVRNTQ